MGNQAKLPKRKVVQFFAADIAKGFFNGMIGNYLLYFYQPTDKSGIPTLLPGQKLLGFITIMALLTGLSKIVDAITDPLVANYSDKCRSNYGRRMPFMRIAAIPYALSVLMIFFAPFNYATSTGRTLNAVWVGFFLILYYVFYTLYFIPQRALVPEIVPDPKQRVGYYGISTAFFMGTSAVMYMATAFVAGFKKAGLSPLWAWRTVFTIFAVIGCACLLLSAFAFNEKKYVMNSTPPSDSIWKSFSIVFKNKNFVMFTIADLLSYISMAFFQTAMMYYITKLINVPEAKASVVMIAAIVTALVCFPIIIRVGQKYNKRVPLIVANAMFGVLFTLIYFGDNIAALMPGKELVLGVMMGIAVAYPFAAINILPQSVLSDIIQADSIKTGVNREGIYSAIKTFFEKIAYAIALVVVSSVLAIGAVGDDQVGMQGIKLTGLIAGIFCVLATIFFVLYKDKDVMNIINTAMDEKAMAVETAVECAIVENSETCVDCVARGVENAEECAEDTSACDTTSGAEDVPTVVDEINADNAVDKSDESVDMTSSEDMLECDVETDKE